MLYKKKVIICIHGYKKPEKDYTHFEDFLNYSRNKINHKIVTFTYFENNEKSTLKVSSFFKEISEKIEMYKNYDEIILVGYSLGAVAALHFSNEFKDKVKKVFLITPVFKVSYFKWVFLLADTIRKKYVIKKKLGKVKYKEFKKRLDENKSIKNKYPLKLTLKMNKFRKKLKKNTEDIKDKKLFIVLCKTDPTTSIKKNNRFVEKMINHQENEIKIDYINQNHFLVLNKNPKLYEQIIDFCNN